MLLLCAVSGCNWIEDIVNVIQDRKGKRSVNFLVMTPVKRTEKETGYETYDDARSQQISAAIREGIQSAANNSKYQILYYNNKKAHSIFYTNLIAANSNGGDASTRSFLAKWLKDLKVNGNDSAEQTEAIMFGFGLTKGPNATAEPYRLYLYDITEDKMQNCGRTVRFENKTEFHEDLLGCVKDLVNKVYVR